MDSGPDGRFLSSDQSSLGAQDTTAQDQNLKQLLDRVWDFELIESPMFATNVGDERGQDRLADDSLEAIERRARTRQEFLGDLNAIPTESLSAMSRIDHELLRLRLEGQLADFRFKTHLMPINNREGFHISFPELPRVMNPKSKADFQKLRCPFEGF